MFASADRAELVVAEIETEPVCRKGAKVEVPPQPVPQLKVGVEAKAGSVPVMLTEPSTVSDPALSLTGTGPASSEVRRWLVRLIRAASEQEPLSVAQALSAAAPRSVSMLPRLVIAVDWFAEVAAPVGRAEDPTSE